VSLRVPEGEEKQCDAEKKMRKYWLKTIIVLKFIELYTKRGGSVLLYEDLKNKMKFPFQTIHRNILSMD